MKALHSSRSVRGNAVLLWEYATGSELFVVWQQTRRSEGPGGCFRPAEDLATPLDSRPETAFMVKVRHHLSP